MLAHYLMKPLESGLEKSEKKQRCMSSVLVGRNAFFLAAVTCQHLKKCVEFRLKKIYTRSIDVVMKSRSQRFPYRFGGIKVFLNIDA